MPFSLPIPLARFQQRLRLRLSRYWRHWVRHNPQWGPASVVAQCGQLAAEHPDRAHVYVVEPAMLSCVEIPPDFYARAPVYPGLHGKPNAQEPFAAACAVSLPHGRVYADNVNSVAILSAANELIGDVSFQYCNHQWTTLPPDQNTIVRQRWFAEPVQVAGTLCSLLSGGGAATGNYYHWLVDSLPRLDLVRRAGLLPEIDFFLVYDRHLSFVRETLQLLGLGPERLLSVTECVHWQAERLIVTTPVRGTGTHTPQWACDFLRTRLLPEPGRGARFSRRVYISRRDASGRRVLNEAALEQLLAAAGFVTYVLSELSMADKIALFAQAEVVVSPLGAGLCNVAFCRPGTVLLELLPQDFAVFDYLEFSSRLGLVYYYLHCPAPRRAHTRQAAQLQDLTVPLESITQFLDLLACGSVVAGQAPTALLPVGALFFAPATPVPNPAASRPSSRREDIVVR